MSPLRTGLAVAALVAAALVPSLQASASTEYFLSPTGSDSAPGTEARPWATFEHALSRLRPGDTLTVRGGTYVERVESPQLTPARPDRPITVRARPGEHPVLKGLLWLRGMDYWRFDGINVTWGDGDPDEHMVKLTDGVGWQYINSEVWGARSFAGILVASSGGSEPSGWRIAGNCVHDTVAVNSTNNDHLVYANSGHNGSGVIEGNIMFNAPNGNGVKLAGSSSDDGGSSNVAVRYNTIVSTHQSVLVGWSSSNNLIEGNLLVGVSDNYANIRSYQLRGGGNRAANNLGTGSKSLFMNDAGYNSIADAGGNLHGVDPEFSSGGCNGYKPTNARVKGYGHTALGSPTRFPERASSSGDSGIVGSFGDDDGSIFEADIERLSAAGITRGCGESLFCPDDPVTRGQMAAFIVRTLHLGAGQGDRFVDDDQSVFEGDIDKLATADITQGCNPPDNSRFCPDRPVTREQMATFLAKALGLSGGGARFGDISGSVHAGDIQALAAAGITRGCNPPDNDRFCPGRALTRAEMAAFLVRAFDL